MEQMRTQKLKKLDDDDRSFKPQIFLDQLINISQTMKKLSFLEIRDHCDTIIFAALETTALTTSHFFLMMAMHPEVQEKVYQEINELFPKDATTIDHDLLKGLDFTEQCIKETMRLFPVGALLAREPMEDGCLGEYKVGAGTCILLNIFSLHRRSDIWGADADQFKPERFTKENSEKRHPFCYLPFSAGPRNCIGYRYASTLMQMMIMRCVREYKFSTRLQFEDLKCVFKFSLKLNTKHWLMIEKR
jgi:cytochrome P450